MMITEQKYTGFHVSLRMVLAHTYKFGFGNTGVLLFYLFIIYLLLSGWHVWTWLGVLSSFSTLSLLYFFGIMAHFEGGPFISP
ncbi:hypothetical protein GGI35DRAFT_65430 [Trichoderma velutinum]